MKNNMQNIQTANIEDLMRQVFNVCLKSTEHLKGIPEMEYFIEQIKHYYSPETLINVRPKVIVFGTDFPLEIVHALTGEAPYWVIGGNNAFNAISDEDVPRDTDPITRSALGQLMAMEQAKASALVILPCSSDAQRKVAFYLQNHGWKVVTIWIPAVKDEATHKGFLSEMEHMIQVLCRHVGKRYSVRALNRSSEYMNSIRESIHSFLKASQANSLDMRGSFRMMVMDSFFMTSDLDLWHQNIKLLTETISKEKISSQPKVLVIGSPIYFPNFKIPELLFDAGVEICGNIDSRSGHYEGIYEHTPKKGIEAIAHFYFEHDSTSAFVWNHELMSVIQHYVEKTQPDGIIWHVLKGQIEYDFELNRCEPYFEERNLPVIRLETDYQYQDVEQLRIRIEAFSELLRQKKAEKGEKHE